jgi:hypothetical protein
MFCLVMSILYFNFAPIIGMIFYVNVKSIFMSRFTSYRHCEIFGKNFQKSELWIYFNAILAHFYRNHFLYVELNFPCM